MGVAEDDQIGPVLDDQFCSGGLQVIWALRRLLMMRKRCPYCRGRGIVLETEAATSVPESCPVCNRRGYNLVPSDARSCSLCGGSGRIGVPGSWKPCPDCGGIGSRW